MTRAWLMAATAVAASIAALGTPAPTAATAPTYATLQLAHSADTMVNLKCQPLSGVITLTQQAAAYKAVGIGAVTATLITDWAGQSSDTCVIPKYGRPYDVASWDEMANLQKTYGWTFVGGSRTGSDLTTLTRSQVQSEVCGSLTDIQSHGLTGGQGEFAFPNNRENTSLEAIALGCGYDFGRMYSGGMALQMALPVPKPYWMKTWSLNGGACNDPAASCYRLQTKYHYVSPASVAQVLARAPGHWEVLQGYDLVTGATRSSTLSWDCTSSNWKEHWSSGSDATEVYCWSDWLAAIRSQEANLTWVTPAQMAGQRVP